MRLRGEPIRVPGSNETSQCSKIEVVDITHKAGVHMGDIIDTMSRIMDVENLIEPPASTRCPSLKPDKYWHCQDIPEMKTLFQLLDPSTIRTHNANHHTAYLQVYDNVNNLLSVINQDPLGQSLISPSTLISVQALHQHRLNGGTTMVRGRQMTRHRPMYENDPQGMGAEIRSLSRLFDHVARKHVWSRCSPPSRQDAPLHRAQHHLTCPQSKSSSKTKALTLASSTNPNI